MRTWRTLWGPRGDTGEDSALAAGLPPLRLGGLLWACLHAREAEARVLEKEEEEFPERVQTGMCHLGVTVLCPGPPAHLLGGCWQLRVRRRLFWVPRASLGLRRFVSGETWKAPGVRT